VSCCKKTDIILGFVATAVVVKTTLKQTITLNNRILQDNIIKTNVKELIDKRKIDLNLFFSISLGLCDILMRYYIDGVLNLRINPQNIEVDLDTMDININNKCFESMNEFYDYGGLENLGRDSIPYISPELSGMMNRTVDYRSDFYSIGVVLYEMLTCKCPFEVRTPSQLIYSHTAKLATPPYKVNKDIPVPISNIVMKLLSKNPEDRYRTSWGIKHDIEICFKEWNASGKINKFKLADKDILDTFEIPKKHYGKRADVKNILSAYNRIAEGASEIMIITGENGMGKSWVVERAKQIIVNSGGYFISGKSSQTNFNIPYESILQALRELVKKILSESIEEIEFIKKELMETMGNNVQVMIDLIPELSFILDGKVSAVKLKFGESEYRFNILFQRFIKVFSRANHPLVIFLDDVQWTHPASLRLITNLLKYYDNKHLLIILGYRGVINTKNKPKDQMEMLLHNLKDNNIKVTKNSLSPLNFEDVNKLLSDALYCPQKETEQLAKVILNKTYGNPLFIDQLMRTLYERELLKFDYVSKAWVWEIKKIIKESIPDNVVDIIAEKISTLPYNTKKLLRLAACLRARFDIQTLSLISEMSVADTLYFLNPAIEAGLIVVVGDYNVSSFNVALEKLDHKLELQFVHDCIQQSAYSMNWMDNHADIHLKAGKLLLENCNIEEFNVKLFDIVNHLNYAKSLMTHEEERLKLVGMNLIAGKKAKKANDYEMALNFFNEGLRILPEHKWENHYTLAFQLSIECAECEFLIGHALSSESLLQEIFTYARSISHKISAYIIKVKILSSLGKHEEAIKTAMEGLKLKKIYIEQEKDEFEFLQVINKLRKKMQKNIEDNLDAEPEIKDKSIIGALNLILEMSQSAAYLGNDIWKSCMLKIVEMSLCYGNSNVSPIGYAGLAHIMCQMSNVREGYKLGTIALNLANTCDDINIRMRVYNIVGFNICTLKQDYSISVSYLEKSFEYAINLGNFNYARLVAYSIILTKFLVGNNINTIRVEMERYLGVLKKSEEEILQYIDILITNLVASVENFEINYMKESLDKMEAFENKIISYRNKSLIGLYYLVKIRFLGIMGRFEEALNLIIEKAELFNSLIGSIIATYFYYATAFIISKAMDESKTNYNKQYLKVLKENLYQLERLSSYNKRNYLSKYLLVSAEVNRIEGRNWESQVLYEKALQQCINKSSNIGAALTCECAAKFYLNQGLETSALAYEDKARSFYEAAGIVCRFVEYNSKYVSLIDVVETSVEVIHEYSSEQIITNIDIDTAIKVSKIISEEIIMDKLLIKLMDIAMESSGAQNGFLILYNDDKLIIEVEGGVLEDVESKVKHIPLEKFNNIAKSVVYYSLRTNETVILNNAPMDSVFSSDNYIIKCRPQSIMCVPIIYNEKLIGVIYLENSVAANVFKPTKLEVLRLISSQAAIAIANATMFKQVKQLNDGLENKVKERTKAIEDTLIKLENEIEKSKRLTAELEYDKLKTEFFANISHELRTPINVILTANQMANITAEQFKQGPLTDKMKKYLELTKQNSYRLIRLTNNLIDITKIDAGYIKMSLCNCDIIKIIEDITISVVEFARRKNIELIFDTEVEEMFLACDPDMMERIMLNLLSNAIKFTGHGGEIQVCVLDLGENIEIRIKDSGVGIPQDKLNKIFDRFVQVDKSLSRNCEGSGIGLSLAKSLIEMQEGSIEVQSQDGIGSEFAITLPVRTVENYMCPVKIESKESKVDRISVEFSDIYF
jgi:predicted ATPase/signal transduction histidine kinase